MVFLGKDGKFEMRRELFFSTPIKILQKTGGFRILGRGCGGYRVFPRPITALNGS
jgi:hypothetical protein